MDVPAEAIKDDGKPLNYAARCVTHEQHTHHATHHATYAAAKASADWCTGCTQASGE